MSKNRELKVQVVADIVEKLKGAESLAVVSYSGLTVEQVTELRKQCREANVQYCVLKNRLVKRAMEEVGMTGLDAVLEGPNAFVFSMDDMTAGPKIVSKFIEKNKLESLKLVAGYAGGEALDAKGVAVLATMPSREELLATLVGCLQSPIASLVAVLDEIAEKKEVA